MISCAIRCISTRSLQGRRGLYSVGWTGKVRSSSAISSSSGSRQRAMCSSSERRQGSARPERAPFFESRHDAPRSVRRLLAYRLDDGFLELLNHTKVDQRPGDIEVESELVPYFAGQLQDDVDQRTTVGP